MFLWRSAEKGHALDVEAGKPGPAAPGTHDLQRICGLPVPVLAGLSYCTASAGMVLLNKFALSSFDFHSITMLLLFQCIFCVIAVKASAMLGIITMEVGRRCSLQHVACACMWQFKLSVASDGTPCSDCSDTPPTSAE